MKKTCSKCGATASLKTGFYANPKARDGRRSECRKCTVAATTRCHREGPRPRRTPIERFMDFVSPEPNSGCWLWVGNWTRGGYGVFRTKEGWPRAPRWSYEYHVGPIPPGLEIDHLCRTPACVNPKHLEPVTHAENLRRSTNPIWANVNKTHCPKGHPYDDANTIKVKQRNGRDGRRCRACANASAKIYQAKKRAA